MSKRNKNNGPRIANGGSDDNFGDGGDDGNSDSNSREFDFSELLDVLQPSSLAHLNRYKCFESRVCATELLVEWTCSGKTVGEGKFVFKNGNILVYIPHARDLVAVLKANLRYKVQEWVRNCERCQFARCAFVPSQDADDEASAAVFGSVDNSEVAAQLMEMEMLGAIKDETKRKIVRLHIREHRTHKEIAEEIGKSHDSVRQIYSREMRRLRKLFAFTFADRELS